MTCRAIVEKIKRNTFQYHAMTAEKPPGEGGGPKDQDILDRVRKPNHDHSVSGRVFARLRTYLLAGVLVTAPISITIYIAWIFIDFVDGKIPPMIPVQYNPVTYLPLPIPGLCLPNSEATLPEPRTWCGLLHNIGRSTLHPGLG